MKKGYVSILSKDELAVTEKRPVWYGTRCPFFSPHIPDKVRRVCNAASKFRGYSLKDVFLAGLTVLLCLFTCLSVVWERLVRSCKKAPYNVLGKQKLSEDKLRTVLCIVEQPINNRTITDVSNDVSDLEPLTPNKWAKEKISEPKVGDLVWIIDKNVTPFSYSLGRITEVYKGDAKLLDQRWSRRI